MSTHSSSEERRAAASLVAQLIAEEASRFQSHSRLYATDLHGLTPSEIAEALWNSPEANHTETLDVGTAKVTAIRVGQNLLIPYLVSNHPGPNKGSRGFGALLRDKITTAPVGPPFQILIVLDPAPVETVKTAARDVASLGPLSWNGLVTASLSEATAQPELIAAVRNAVATSPTIPRSAETLAALMMIAQCRGAASLGRELSRLPLYLPDPSFGLRGDPAKRLERNEFRRRMIDDWAMPERDFAKEVVKRYGAPQAGTTAEALIRARGVGGVDYTLVTLDMLEELQAPESGLKIARPLVFAGHQAVHTKRGNAAIWLPGGGTFAIRLSGTPAGKDAATISWSHGTTTIGRIDPDYRWARFAVVENSDQLWLYGVLSLSGAEPLNVAVYCGTGQWFPVEAAVDIDVAEGAFRYVGSEPQILAISSSSAVLGYAAAAQPEEPEQTYSTVTVIDGYQDRPLISLLRVGPLQPYGEGSPDDEEPTDQPGESSDDDESDKPQYPALPPQKSVAHAVLKLCRSISPEDIGAVDLGRGTASNRIIIGSQDYLLADQTVSGIDGLQLERAIICEPQTWAWSLASGSGAMTPDPALSHLQLTALNQPVLERFIEARKALFSALKPYGTVHAIPAGRALTEAAEYCDAYTALISSLPRDTSYQIEYDRIVLCDAVSLEGSDEMLIAPTHPQTVAFLIAASQKLQQWRSRAGEVMVEDLEAVGVRHLLPVFKYRQSAYVADNSTATPWLWRRYVPQAAGTAEAGPKAICKRIQRFLEVFPEYRSGRQHLAVMLIEPGDADVFLQALRRFYEQEIPAKAPHLDVILVAASPDRPTRLEAALTEADAGAQYGNDRLLKARVTLTKVNEVAKAGFAHLAFVFNSEMRRDLAQVKIGSRGSTMWVNGLAASTGRLTHTGPNETSFSSGTFARSAASAPDIDRAASALLDITFNLHELVGGMPNQMLQNGWTQLPTTRVAAGFLHEIYDHAVWVVHLDGMLGLEAFAPNAGSSQERYVIDYDDRPDPARPGQDVITATTQVEPYHQALSAALRAYGNPDDKGLRRSLQVMNAVSGRWALGMLGARHEQLQERIGVVAAIVAIADLDDAFGAKPETAAVLLPLDEFFETLPRGTSRPRGSICDDLMYLRMAWTADEHLSVVARLIEVKHHREGLTHMTEARRQLEATVSFLGSLFAPGQPQSEFRNRDLAEAIRAAVIRARAFGLSVRDLDPDLESMIAAIADGRYDLTVGFYVGGQEKFGDVVSVEPGSETAAHRSSLPGDGRAFGLVRLGAPVLRALAAGERPSPPAGWQPISFEPPQNGIAGQPGGPSSPDDDGQPELAVSPTADPIQGRSAETAPRFKPTDSGQTDLTVEIVRTASDLDVAVAKYGLTLEPFLPERAQAGPSLIRFRSRTLGRQTLSAIKARELDLGREIGVADGVLVSQEDRFITIDVPRAEPETIRFSDYAPMLDDARHVGALNFLVGMAPDNSVRIADLASLPHLLIAGATGSGKSVFLRGLLCSLIHTRSPMSLSLLLIDPKQVDFVPFQKAMHLADGRIITDPAEAVDRLAETLEREVPNRQSKLTEAGVYNIDEYYAKGGSPDVLPQMVIVVDEFADLVSGLDRESGRDFLSLIQRYSQKTRALGIYLVLATQRPSVKVITGDIKNNLTARVALKVPTRHDSQTILGDPGAESLRRRGDMIFDDGESRRRLQGFLCTTDDVRAAITSWDIPGSGEFGG